MYVRELARFTTLIARMQETVGRAKGCINRVRGGLTSGKNKNKKEISYSDKDSIRHMRLAALSTTETHESRYCFVKLVEQNVQNM
jgi:hypothetical protein